jgi:hypothetical protein
MKRLVGVAVALLMVGEWAKRSMTPIDTIYTRLYRGWPPREAVFGRSVN